MFSNLKEWCTDWWDAAYYAHSALNDPTGPDAGSIRVFRGGSWDYTARYCRSACRDWSQPSFRQFYLGFRLARSSVE